MLTLERRTGMGGVPVEAECISPDRIMNATLSEIERFPVNHGNRTERLADHFKIAGASGPQIQLLGECSEVKWIGAGMSNGSIIVEGNAGMHLGSEMNGGEIVVRGNAGDWVGAEMKGGRIRIQGNAGHLVGAAYRGGKIGMTGGEILIDGNSGNETAGQMRRGLIVVGGECGDFAGVAMRAGSLIVLGALGIRPGAGMLRGTIALLRHQHTPPQLLPTFRWSCEFQPLFLAMFLQRIRQLGFEKAPSNTPRCARYNGDMVELGKGEILVAVE